MKLRSGLPLVLASELREVRSHPWFTPYRGSFALLQVDYPEDAAELVLLLPLMANNS